MKRFFKIRDPQDCEEYKVPFSEDPPTDRDAYYQIMYEPVKEAAIEANLKVYVIIDYLVLCTERVQVTAS